MTGSGTQELVGYRIETAPGDGVARCRMTVDERHLNRAGILHGGMTATLLDTAMGATASLSVDPAGRAPFSTLSLTVHYLAPGGPGAVTATGRVVGGGAATLFLEGTLIADADGTVLATASGVFRRMRA